MLLVFTEVDLDTFEFSNEKESLEPILEYSPFSTVQKLLQQFNKIGKNTGTRIVIYNLKDEFDFSVDDDIQIRDPLAMKGRNFSQVT